MPTEMGRPTIYKTLQIKLKIEYYEPHKKKYRGMKVLIIKIRAFMQNNAIYVPDEGSCCHIVFKNGSPITL